MTQGQANILAIGTALPQHALHINDIAALLSQTFNQPVRGIQKLLNLTAIETRHSVLGDELQEFYALDPSTAKRMGVFQREAPKLAIQALENLKPALPNFAAITQLITVSCTGFSAPDFDLDIITTFDLPRNIQRLHVGFMGCAALFNALQVAQDHCCRNKKNLSLIVSVELCSLHMSQHSKWERNVGNFLFGDGAAAILVGSAEQSIACLGAGHSIVMPCKRQYIDWRIGDNGFSMYLSRNLAKLVKEHVPPVMRSWLNSQELTIADIKTWLFHPGGKAILDAIEQGLCLEPAALKHSRAVLRDCGNLSSASIAFVFERASTELVLPAVALGFGPGVSIEAQLLK